MAAKSITYGVKVKTKNGDELKFYKGTSEAAVIKKAKKYGKVLTAFPAQF